MTFTGFAITGDAPQLGPVDYSLYASFAAAGVGTQNFNGAKPRLEGNLPVIPEVDIPSNATQAAATIAAAVPPSGDLHPAWMMYRTILTGPAFIEEVASRAFALSNGAAVVVSPLELSCLMRVALNGSNDNRAAYVGDTIPDAVAAAPYPMLLHFNVTVRMQREMLIVACCFGAKCSQSATVSVAVADDHTVAPPSHRPLQIRNDGWNALRAGTHALVVSTPSITRLFATNASVGGGRSKWAQRGLRELHAGTGTAHLLRRRLAAAGIVGATPELLVGRWGAALGAVPSEVFGLPADAPVGGSVVVPARVSVPASTGGYLLSIVYQIAELAPGGDVARTFDAYGIIPWESVVLVGNATKAEVIA